MHGAMRWVNSWPYHELLDFSDGIRICLIYVTVFFNTNSLLFYSVYVDTASKEI